MKTLPVGATVAGSFEVEGKEIPFAGGVAWAKPGDRYQNLLGRMGVCFTRISEEFLQLIDSPRLNNEGYPNG